MNIHKLDQNIHDLLGDKVSNPFEFSVLVTYLIEYQAPSIFWVTQIKI
jgi:hypothetical protein